MPVVAWFLHRGDSGQVVRDLRRFVRSWNGPRSGDGFGPRHPAGFAAESPIVFRVQLRSRRHLETKGLAPYAAVAVGLGSRRPNRVRGQGTERAQPKPN